MTDRPRGLIRGSGRRGAPHGLDEIVSVRFGGHMLARLRKLAAADNMTVSQWIRAAAASEALRRSIPQAPPGFRVVGWKCQHVTITAAAIISEASCGAGCEMQPVYEALPAVA